MRGYTKKGVEEDYKMKYFAAFLCVVCLFPMGISWAADKYIGSIKTLDGTVTVVSRGKEVDPVVGTRLFVQDRVTTGHNGSVGIILQDDTVFTLGPDSELALKEFRFDPKKNDFSLVSRMVRGTFVYVSGIMGKLSPKSIRIETPDGIVAIRGTKFAAQIQE